MSKPEVKDKLNFICDKNFQTVVGPTDSLLWSGDLFKINKKTRRQERNFLITSTRIINIGKKGNFLSNLFSKSVKRSFKIESITAITYSSTSNNIVLHVTSEYDYNISSADKNDIIRYIMYVQKELGLPPLPIYIVDDVDLFRYTKYEGQKQEKLPQVEPVRMDLEGFEAHLRVQSQELDNNIKNTEVIISTDGSKVNENSFELLKNLGKGYFGKVFLVEKKDSKELYALKVISKLDIIKRNFFENLRSEKQIMQKIHNPFVVNLEYCFASPSYVFFAMKFKQGGELYYHLRKNTRFTEEVAKFYACQILEGLSYLHANNIIYRDMKPENILLDEKGNCCLADFGISKILGNDASTRSFVGTPEYVAPEVILQTGHNKSVDIWCFGILLYEMVVGLPPFYNKNQNTMLNWIVKLDPTFPKTVKISDDLRSLIILVS